MRSIGGFFELELRSGREYHSNAIKLNSGRNALSYILSANNYLKIYIPRFICEVLPQMLIKSRAEFAFYGINKEFEPLFDYEKIKEGEAFLYINYFGLKDSFINTFQKYKFRLIIDNAQSFYSLPIEGIDTFYSPRKFFGVPDGAYLYSNNLIKSELEESVSSSRMKHLVKRIEEDAESAYALYNEAEISINSQPVLKMSRLTEKLLSSIDYESAAKKRRENFEHMENSLGYLNKLKLPLGSNSVPMVYPFYNGEKRLRDRLIGNRIYTAVYWPGVIESVDKSLIEYDYSMNIVHLPIDQRYGKAELNSVINIVKNGR